MTQIEFLLERLQSFSAPNVFNPWDKSDPLDAQEDPAEKRQWRLARHLDCRPKYLLIGEAPGYQGCHFSGVPFTNEKLLLDGVIPRVKCDQRITTRPLPWSEPSATVIWRTLHFLNIAESTVLWNAFAFHPHCAGKPYSNRAPTKNELKANVHILALVVSIFPNAKMVAVGNVAKRALSDLGYISDHVRHPSMGGATKFREGMEKIASAAP